MKLSLVNGRGLALGVLATLGLVFSANPSIGLPSVSKTETVMEKVKRTGVLTAGTSKDAIPFAYRNREGELVGYSVDMLKLVKQQLEKDLGRELELKLVALAPDQRIPGIKNSKVDIVCDASSFTWKRDREVDFTLSYGNTGTRLLVKKDSPLGSAKSLVGKRIGVLAQTTNEQAIKRVQPLAELVYVKDRNSGYNALRNGKIDALASDGILLEGWLAASKRNNNYKIVPDRPYSREGIACMVPENNSDFLDSVNYTLYQFMYGFVTGKTPNVQIFDRWFGPQGIIPLNRDLRSVEIETMQLTIESRQEIPKSDF
ncbi:MAG: amino acid ABC transporter substrate-binding protein [Cyanobacteria bacterium P01_A01_bin.45]